jgi:Methyltransferase domain
VLPVQRFHWDSAEYVEAFATLVRCYGERVCERQILRELFAAYPADSRAVDWGAGSGDLTSLLLEHFHHVFAVEPHPGMRAVLATRCPLAQVVDGTIMSTVPPTQVEVGLISHVFYHVPDYKWGAYTMHAAQQLTEKGILIVSLKTVDSGCNQMLEAFGAPSYDLQGSLARVMRLHPEFTFAFLRAPASITTTSFAETLTIARSCCVTGTRTPSRVPRRRRPFRPMSAGTSGTRGKGEGGGSATTRSAACGAMPRMPSLPGARAVAPGLN